MSLPRLAVLRPITTAMLIISVLVVGGIALVKLPHDYLPKVDAPFIQVQIPYPNSNPSQIEREITKPVEEVLSTLASVKTLSSTSSAARFRRAWAARLPIGYVKLRRRLQSGYSIAKVSPAAFSKLSTRCAPEL